MVLPHTSSFEVHVGYCDLAGDDKIAECTNNPYIADATLPGALAMLPSTVEVIFLNGISGITALPDSIFQDNLKKRKFYRPLFTSMIVKLQQFTRMHWLGSMNSKYLTLMRTLLHPPQKTSSRIHPQVIAALHVFRQDFGNSRGSFPQHIGNQTHFSLWNADSYIFLPSWHI